MNSIFREIIKTLCNYILFLSRALGKRGREQGLCLPGNCSHRRCEGCSSLQYTRVNAGKREHVRLARCFLRETEYAVEGSFT